MKLSDFDYELPKNLIAQEPVKPRDKSRLLVLHRTGVKTQITDKYFYNIVDYLNKGDVLVLNNSKVIPARLMGKKIPTGGKIEVFLLRKNPHNYFSQDSSDDTTPLPPLSGGRNHEVWQCLIGGKGRKENLLIEFGHGLKAEILRNNRDGTWQVAFNKKGKALMKIVNKIGLVPLPPYIKRYSHNAYRTTQNRKINFSNNDEVNYQTVYANDKKLGSVAAPTAGLHFTSKLLKKIKAKGVRIVYITLHVGLGTFAPVKTEDITKYKMHAEYVEVTADAIKRIIQAKSKNKRIIATGTTSVRTLESVFGQMTNDKFQMTNQCQNSKSKIINKIKNQKFEIKNYLGWINLFIYPGYKFKVVDAMITNFHLPKSTLLMLVSAFAGPSTSLSTGRRNIMRAYRHAIRKKYRFYSYGDAMLIH